MPFTTTVDITESSTSLWSAGLLGLGLLLSVGAGVGCIGTGETATTPPPSSPLLEQEPPPIEGDSVTEIASSAGWVGYRMGDGTIALERDGVMQSVLPQPTGTFRSITAFWVGPDGAVWVGGYIDAGPQVARWDGSAWVVSRLGGVTVEAIHGRSDDDVYVSVRDRIHHWNGSAFEVITLPAGCHSHRVVAVSDRLYVQCTDSIRSFDGTSFNAVDGGDTPAVRLTPGADGESALGFVQHADSCDVYEIADDALVLRTTLSVSDFPATTSDAFSEPMVAVGAYSPTDIWVPLIDWERAEVSCTFRGYCSKHILRKAIRLVHFDGESWTEPAHIEEDDVFMLASTGPDQAVAVGLSFYRVAL